MKSHLRVMGGTLLSFALVASMVAAASAAEKADPNGTWKWTFNTPDGQNIDASTELKLEGETLTGKVSAGDRSFDISDGTFAENEVTFNVVAENNGSKLTTNFKGKVEADSITGKIKIEVNGETLSFDWNATRHK